MKNLKFNSILNNLLKFSQIELGLLAIIVLSTVFYSLNKGLIFSDEAWYLLHLRFPEATIPLSQWHAYAIKLFPKNTLQIRMTIFGLFIFSGFVFTYGFSKFVAHKKFWLILTVAIIGLFVLYTPVQFVPNYMTFNTIVIFTGSGLFLVALAADKNRSVALYSILAGIVFVQLLFIMITNMAIYLALLLLPLFLQERKKALCTISSLILGSLFGLTLFFLCIKSPSEYYSETLLAIKYHSFDKTHGFKDLITWCINTLYYVIKELSLPAFVLLYLKRHFGYKLNIKHLAFAMLALYYITITISDLRTNFRNITPPTILLSITSFIIIDLFLNKQYKLAILGIFFFFIPIFGCLGTDVSFSIRSSLYMMPILMFTAYYAIINKEKKLYFLIFLFIAFATFRFSILFTHSSGWNGYTIAHQTEPLKKLNIKESIKLDTKRFKTVEEIRSVIKPGDITMISHHNLWGYVYLTNAKVELLNFKFNEQLLNYHFKENNTLKNMNKLVLIEDIRNPFPEGYINNLRYKNHQIKYLDSDINLSIHILKN